MLQLRIGEQEYVWKYNVIKVFIHAYYLALFVVAKFFVILTRNLILFFNFTENKYLKMQECGDFDDLRMDQRFEVRNDELASICSKFAPGGF